MGKQSLADEFQELTNEYADLRKKIEETNNKISVRKSIQSQLGFFGLILFFFLFTVVGGVITTIVLGTFEQYSDLFLILGFILVVAWLVFFGGSRIIAKNISTYSILRDKLSEQFEETKSNINQLKLLIDKKEQTLKKFETQETASEAKLQSLDLKQNDKGNYDFEEEQKKEGLVKFVPISLQISELMTEEGHDKAFKSKISKKWKQPKDVPTEITWGTPEQVFEWIQKEKGYTKFVDDAGKIRWGTEKQIAKWQKEENNKTLK